MLNDYYVSFYIHISNLILNKINNINQLRTLSEINITQS